MGGWICLIICVVPIYFFYVSNHIALMIFSIVNAAIYFWSFGVMHNYAMKQNSLWAEQVQKNKELEEGPLGIEEKIKLQRIGNKLRPEDVPEWLAYLVYCILVY
jgi:4-amino-4-deoxy-L-arabinose transferase-like glycosyltransferase